MAFFLDAYWPHTRRGTYTLTIEETDEQAVGLHTEPFEFVKPASDGGAVARALEFLSRAQIESVKPRSEAAQDAASPAGAGGVTPRQPGAPANVRT